MLFFFQAEDGIRDVERSRGLGDVYKRQIMDPLASNPSSIPIKAVLDEEMSKSNYCEELIFITEGNPIPLACRFKFTPLAGTTEVSFRTRLIDAQYIRALARMNDGRILSARRYVTVVAGACGM